MAQGVFRAYASGCVTNDAAIGVHDFLMANHAVRAALAPVYLRARSR